MVAFLTMASHNSSGTLVLFGHQASPGSVHRMKRWLKMLTRLI